MSNPAVGRYQLGERLRSDALTATHESVVRDERGHEQRVHVRVARLPEDLDPELPARFLSDAGTAKALEHANVVRLIDFGTERESAYTVVPASQTMTLRALLTKQEGKKISPELVALVGLDVLRGLDVAHSRQPPLLHGGISPDALVVDADGLVQIADFALVGLLAAASNAHSSLLEHTCRYHSPEQAKHRPLTPATDVFSLGATLYEALTGKPAFFAPTPLAIVLKISMAAHDKLDNVAPEVPAPIRQIVTRMLAADPSQRPRDRELIDQLEKIVGRPERARTELGRCVRPTTTPAASPVAPATPAVSVAMEAEESWDGADFPAFDEIPGEKTVLDTRHAIADGPAPPPPRVAAPELARPVRATVPLPLVEPSLPAVATSDFATAERTDEVLGDVEGTAQLENPGPRFDDQTPQYDQAHPYDPTPQDDHAPQWGVERTMLIASPPTAPRIEERPTPPPAPPRAPQTYAAPDQPWRPSYGPPVGDPAAAPVRASARNVSEGLSLPILIAIGVGALMIVVGVAVLTAWLAS